MKRALAPLLVAIGLPALIATPAGAAWSPARPIAAPAAAAFDVAVNARGDLALAWSTRDARARRRTSVHVVSVPRDGRLVRRIVWSSRRTQAGSVVVAIDRHGEITVAWDSSTPTARRTAVRAAYGRSASARWARARIVGYGSGEPLPAERQPRLAVAPDDEVLLTWDSTAPRLIRPAAAWRAPRRPFGPPRALSGSSRLPRAMGPIASFDAVGAAYVWGWCSGVVLRAAPGSHRFGDPVVLAPRALAFDLALGGPGEGLATWIDGSCTSDPAAGSVPGPVFASALHAGRWGTPLALTAASEQAVNTVAFAGQAGGGVASWATPAGVFSADLPAGGLAGPSRGIPDGLVPVALADEDNEILAGATTFPSSFVQGGVRVYSEGGAAQDAPAGYGALAVAAPPGGAAALAWPVPGSLAVSVWRPEPVR